jgi:hypothetical protein
MSCHECLFFFVVSVPSAPVGRKTLEAAKEKIHELFGELFEDSERTTPSRKSK